MNPLCLLEAEQNRSFNLQFIWLLLQACMSWIKFHTKISALQLSYSEKGINISINIIYKVCEFTGSSAIVTGWSLSTEVLGFLDSYVISRHFLKQVSADNLVVGPVLVLCLVQEAPPWQVFWRRMFWNFWLFDRLCFSFLIILWARLISLAQLKGAQGKQLVGFSLGKLWETQTWVVRVSLEGWQGVRYGWA